MEGGINPCDDDVATTAAESIEMLQTTYVQFQSEEVSLPAPPAATKRKKFLKLPVSRQLQRSDYSVVICSILLCFPIGLPGLWFLYKAKKSASAKEIKKSWRFILIGRLLGRIAVVIGIIASMFALIGLYIAAG